MNKGLNLQKEIDEIRGDEWKFGAESKPSLFSIGIAVREQYLPEGELQYIGSEKYDCVTRAYVNKLEVEFTYAYQNNLLSVENKKWLEDNGYVLNNKVVFSDAFIGILSGTTKAGNSLKAPAHAIHKNGLIPKHLMPQLENFDEHYSPLRIKESYLKLGKDFISRFPINYEQVDAVNLEKAIEKDMTAIAIFAYGEIKNGEYQRSEAPMNHCVLAFKLPRTYVFDNYIDGNDGDFIKKLSPNYAVYPYGYRIYIDQEKVITMWSIWDTLRKIAEAIGLLSKKVDNSVEVKPEEVYNEVKESMKLEKLYDVSRSLLGKRLTLDKSVPINVGCAQAVSYVLKQAGYKIPKGGISGTYTLYEWLQKNFTKIDTPEKGCVVISPTTVEIGHVGICGELNKMYPNDYAVMSNDSITGKYDTQWRLEKWIKHYKKLGTFYFKP